MRKLRELWNFKMGEESFRSIKMRALRYFVSFMLLMACCTLVARAADGRTVALVQAERPARNSITHSVEVSGVLESSGDVPVTAPSGMLVTNVHAQKGDTVEEGSLLFRFDTSELEDQIAAKKREVRKARKELEAAQENALVDEEKVDRDIERTQEDNDDAIKAAEQKIFDAREAVTRAERDYSVYMAFTDPEQFTYQQMLTLQDAVYARKKELDQALADLEKVKRDNQRDLDDALPGGVDVSLELQEMDYRNLSADLKALQKLVETDGEVYAPMGGIVTDVNVEVGKRTGDDALVLLNDAQSMQFVAEITKEQKKHVELDDKLGLTLPGEERVLELIVDSLFPVPEKDTYELRATLPEGKGTPDLAASAEVKQRGQRHNFCVPLSAIYTDSPDNYVLVLREVETALGKEYIAERVDVQVLDSNESIAAINGALTEESRIITGSSRPLSDGDRVRLEAE